MKQLLLIGLLVMFINYARADCRVDTIYSYEFIPGTSVKEKTDRIFNMYDSSGNQTLQLYQRWDAGSSAWKNYSKIDWTYDANGCMSSADYYYDWNAGGNYFNTHGRYEYFNTAINNTGIASLNKNELSICPNPATTQLAIQTKNDWTNATATITDLFGRVVLQEKLNQSQTGVRQTQQLC